MAKQVDFKDYSYMMRFMKPRMFSYQIGLWGQSITDASIMIMVPFLMKYMIDAAIKGDMFLLKRGLSFSLIMALIVSLAFVITGSFFRKGINRTLTDIRTTLFRHIQNLPVTYFEEHHSGDLLSRVANDMKCVEEVIGWPIRMALFITISGIGSIIAMLLLDWKIGLVLLTIGTISAFINTNFALAIKKISEKIQKAMGVLAEKMSDIFSGISIIKIFQIQPLILGQYQAENDALFQLQMARVKQTGLLDSINFLISWMNFGGIIAVGALLFVKGATEFGTVIALTHLLGSVNFMIRRLGGILAHIQGSMAGVSRITELLQLVEEPERYEISPAQTRDEMIKLEDLCFAYDASKPVLKDLNLSVGKGKVVALVGASGGGKSTIIKLLLGFYIPSSGKVSINGRGLGSYTLEELRKIMTYVPQDAYLFDGTVEENIKYGRPEAGTEEIVAAAQAANAHQFIEEMVDGYQTVVGERGVRLSGGQRQRIAIARALLKDAPILLLDEATSSLDSQSEQQVQEALGTLMQGRTVVVVAHRLSTIEHADLIYVIEDGGVAEAGSHEELLAQNGLYNRLHKLQFSVEEERTAINQ